MLGNPPTPSPFVLSGPINASDSSWIRSQSNYGQTEGKEMKAHQEGNAGWAMCLCWPSPVPTTAGLPSLCESMSFISVPEAKLSHADNE